MYRDITIDVPRMTRKTVVISKELKSNHIISFGLLRSVRTDSLVGKKHLFQRPFRAVGMLLNPLIRDLCNVRFGSVLLINYFEGPDAQDRFVFDPLHATRIRIDRPVDSLIVSAVLQDINWQKLTDP